MFGDGSLTFREFVMREPIPLAAVQDAVLEFLRGRDDAALFGAQAVNAYVDEPRMTQDVDILCTRAAEFAEELRSVLHDRFHIAIRIRAVARGAGYRLYQVRKPTHRHLVDVRSVQQLPACKRLAEVLVLTPAQLVGHKVLSMMSRRKTPKGMTDAADLRRLLLTFPELKAEEGPVSEALREMQVPAEALGVWRDLVGEEILPEDEQAGF
jgi:hypothetical protein